MSRDDGTVARNQPAPDPSVEWWTTSDVAAYLGLQVATVSSYRLRGQMPEPDLILGRTHVWHPSTIMAWHRDRPGPGVGGKPTGRENLDACGGEHGTNELTPDRAAALLRQGCAAVGLDPAGARLLRLGSNAVYRLSAPVVVRLSRRSLDVERVRRTVAVARWLGSVNFPAVRALDVDQPVSVDEHLLTFWEPVSDDGDRYANVREVAEVLARLHRLIPPESLHLPQLSPFQSADQRIESSTWLNDADRAFLVDRLAELRKRYAELAFVLPEGVIHGDASVGNVLRDRQDNPVLIDLDGFAIGPREWDLALTAVYYDSFGWHTREEYETFVRVYGFDIMQWTGYPTIRDVREFLMVTWILQKASESERIATEVRKRIAALRTGASRKDWEPY
jgi:aminoglycoside phosphotransferase (APT) family kinase protein